MEDRPVKSRRKLEGTAEVKTQNVIQRCWNTAITWTKEISEALPTVQENKLTLRNMETAGICEVVDNMDDTQKANRTNAEDLLSERSMQTPPSHDEEDTRALERSRGTRSR